MRILINGTTLVVGGGLQVGRSLITELAKNPHGHSIRNVVSTELAAVLPKGMNFTVISPSPAKPWSGRHTRDKLTQIEQQYKPDIVFTIFGPAYWKPRACHVCGYGDPWTFAANKNAWRSLRFKTRVIYKLASVYKEYRMFQEDYRAIVVESSFLRDPIRKRLKRAEVYVIPNTYGQPFFEEHRRRALASSSVLPSKKEAGEFRIVTLSQYYPHKNLEIVPEVACRLKEKAKDGCFRFFLSLDPKSPDWARIKSEADRLGVSQQVLTTGPIPPHDAPLFYDGVDVMFLPTLLESFSANYPEAMIMGVPIVTTDLPFAHDVCADSALYFEPLDAEAAADRIVALYNNRRLRDDLISSGRRRVQRFPSPEERAEQYISVCEKVAGVHVG